MSAKMGPSAFEFAERLAARDESSRRNRSRRLVQMNTWDKRPAEGSAFLGGVLAFEMFEEARLAYLNEMYFCLPILVLCFIELELAGRLYATGLERAKRLSVQDLTLEARKRGLVDTSLDRAITRLRNIRNALTHFRRPLGKQSLTGRMVARNRHYGDIAVKDGVWSIKLMFRFEEVTRWA